MPCREPGCSCEVFRLKPKTKNQCVCSHSEFAHVHPSPRPASPTPPPPPPVSVLSPTTAAAAAHTPTLATIATPTAVVSHLEGDFSYVVTFSFLGAPAHDGEEDFWEVLAHAGILRCFTNYEDRKDYLEFRLIENYIQKVWKVALETCFLPNHDALKKSTSAMKAKSFFKKKGVAELIPEQPEIHLVYSTPLAIHNNSSQQQSQPTQLHIGFSSQKDKTHFLTHTASKVKIVTSSTHVQPSTPTSETRVVTTYLEQTRRLSEKKENQLPQLLQQQQQQQLLQLLQQQQQHHQQQAGSPSSPSLTASSVSSFGSLSSSASLSSSSSSSSLSSSSSSSSLEDLSISVHGGHSCFELTFDMMMGIRTVVSKVEAQTMRPCASAYEYSQTSRIRFPAKGSKSTPAHGGTDFYFKDYCPMLFRRIRARFGIDPAHYLLTLCGDFAYLEFVSNSKSGEFFFFSHNREFLIKTISKAECKMLLRVMEEYFHHISSCEDTFITRFFGVHKVRPGKARETYFLIMGSVFPTTKSIHATFDLKGATLGRTASEQDKLKGNKCVYKDNDFREQNVRIKIGVRNKARLMNQIKKDVALLEKFGIMDYSMLVGIHYKDRANEPFLQTFTRQDSIRAIDAGYQPLPISSPSASSSSQTASAARGQDRERERVGGLGEDLSLEKVREKEVLGVGRSIEGGDACLIEDEQQDSSDSSEDEKGLFYIWQKEDLLAAAEDSVHSTSNSSSHSNSNSSSVESKFETPHGKKSPSSAGESPAASPNGRASEDNKSLSHSSSTEKIAGKGFFQLVDGGFESSSEHGSNEVYFMGIIDILIEYGIKKKGETLVKSLRHNKAEISSVDPSMYAERFVKFLEASID